MKYILLFIVLTISLVAKDYEIGYGYKVNDALHISGYLSTEYSGSTKSNKFEFDDLALLAYGNLSGKFSYFLELESSSLYKYDLDTDESFNHSIIHLERAYVDYVFSYRYKIRLGKQITPIGYWNYEPINVLRDTTSNPIYSYRTFPKLLSGIDVYGRINQDGHLNYHAFIQANKDLDQEALNIKSVYFYGISLKYDLDDLLSLGGALGTYKIRDTNEVVNLFQLDAIYKNDRGEIKTELAYNDIRNDVSNVSNQSFIGYIQGKYYINDKEALVSRYEYINEKTIGHIGVLGYSYRPIYPISIKTEYQIHSDNSHNKVLISFSVLF